MKSDKINEIKTFEPEPLMFTRPDKIVCNMSWEKRGVIPNKIKWKYKQKKRNKK